MAKFEKVHQQLKKALKDASERVKDEAVKALNEASEEVQTKIKINMSTVGIHERTGRLKHSIKVIPATKKNFKAVIQSEVFGPVPKEPGKRNPAMRGRYKFGAPYGRILEFSPRKDKEGKPIAKPFFYSAWYETRKQVSEEIIQKIGKAWSEKE